MSDIRREDLRTVEVLEVYGELRPEVIYHRVTDAEVLQAVLYEDCKGGCDQGKVPLKGGTQGDCLVCGGEGRVLREGVERIEPWEEFVNGDPVAALFIAGPFEWLEADNE